MAYAPDEITISHGKSIGYAATSSGPFTKVEGTTEISFPEREWGKAEFTNDSSPDFTKEYKIGTLEPGTVSFSYRYGATQFEALETIFQLAKVAATRGSATKFWEIELPDGATAIVAGFLTKHNLPSSEGEDILTVECEIQCSGSMTYAAPAGA